MAFPFALSRMILLSFIVVMNVILTVLSAVAFHEKTGGGFQVLAICFSILSVLTVIGFLCHQHLNRDKESSNFRNLCLFAICGLLGFVLAVSLTVHAWQDRDVQLGMAYVLPVFASIGFVISWIDKFPGAIRVTPRYPITKAPSSHFAAHVHDLDGGYTRAPAKSSKPRNDSGWTDVPIC